MQSSRPRPIYLGSSSQKGGVGKSTLAEILSSMLYYEEGISLFVVDCDLMDYILSPLEPDIQSMVACLSYAKSIQDLGVSMQTARIKDIWLLWNKVDRRVRNTLVTHYTQHIQEEGLTLVPFPIYRTHRFSHELSMYGARGVFRSTYLPPNKALRVGTNIDELAEWVLSALQLPTPTTDGDD